jgi:pimeloyl-ACP methyl ester carboxylesterase
MSLYIQESGTHGAPTVLFLHGAGTSSWMWDVQVQDLSDFHCLALDLPGHGKSNHVPWVSLEGTAAQVADIIRQRATNQRAFVVGLSLGGYIALYLLANHPERVERAVLSGVTALPFKHKRLAVLQMRLMAPFMKQRWFVKSQARLLRIPADVMDVYTQSMLAMSTQAFVGIFKELMDFQLPSALANSHVPTLVTAGGAEVALILESLPVLARTLPAAEVRVAPGLHHGWNGEAPELFSSMLRAWFTGAVLPEGLQPLLEPVR